MTMKTTQQMTKKMDNNRALRELWESTGLTHPAALALINQHQIRPMASSAWLAYMAGPTIARRRTCPDEILAYAQKILGGH